MKKKKSDSLKCSVELEDSGLDLKSCAIRTRAYINQPAQIEIRKDKIANQLTSVQKDSLILDVSGQMTSIDMLAKHTEQDLETKNSLRQISEISPQIKYLSMSFLQQDFPVKLFPLPANAKVFKTKQRELFSMKFAELLGIKDLNSYSLRMLKGYFLMTPAEPSQLYSFHWMSLGMMQNGKCLTLNITCHRTGKGSLSSVLEEEVDEKYYLSDRTLKKIMEKKDADPNIEWKSGIKGQGKVAFPDDINKPSRAITTAEGGASRMTHGIDVIQCGHRTKGKPRFYKDQIPAMAQDYGTGGQNVPMISHAIRAGGKPSGIDDKRNWDSYLIERRVRRLTPRECERLQGFPDDWTKGVSDTQRYKQMGNAVSVPVIEALGRSILKVINK